MKPLFRATILRRTLSYARAYSMSSPVLRVLGLESSCDDTAAAIVSSDGQILGETNVHQHTVHEQHGGIVPGLAANHHLKNMPLVVHDTLKKAGMQITDLDAIAVTRGPGLPASLAVCVAAGKTLAAVHAKPLIGVHHMEAHALMARMTSSVVQFPFLCLLISGGHTLSLVVHGINQYTMVGTTRDDSVGEAFDKVARELQVPWISSQEGGGAGPALERLARDGDPLRFALPVPMDKADSAASPDFSFSGLKTRIKRMREQNLFNPVVRQDQADVAAAFQLAATKHLRKKTALAFRRAREMHVDVTCLVASGGVASNLAVRESLEQLATSNGVDLVCPPPSLCTDNGVMIAWAGIERLKLGLLDPYTIDFIQRWPLEDLKTMGYRPRASSF
ncbi:Mitochondrial tRNAs modification protein [Coemansia erecta]|uniref:N(6)-L-threonylcarbamoyladenine synthase n=1 Tax=Coemansia asiatica TaxID=1052880 RepID=A0A9W7XNQ3_9FUNG|nr:Mitochondrial tRNAs modification protein [Coemansia asiatica]KAJ2855015.1 Mitochondrial tRNAs modification protein [Coemansia erecta]KAJ2882693.1 Mitochondrial tRNAs modification protein [Coemansia asiatica]